MAFTKNINYLLLISFIVGLSVGYLLGNNKHFTNRSIEINNFTDRGNDYPSNKNKNKTDLTAKEAYDIAAPEAKLWSDDAYLAEIHLASKKFEAGGFSNGWKTVFYSEKKNKLYEITIKDGESRGGKEKDAMKSIQTLKGEFLDSSKTAESFFFSHPADTEVIALKMYYNDNAKKFLWTLFFPGGSHTIDAEL